MRLRPALSLAVVVVVGFAFGGVCADRCAYVVSDFSCSQQNAYSAMAASGCKCFSCTEQDGSGSYQCKDAPTCRATYTVTDAGASDNETPAWSTGAYAGISAVFIGVSLVVYGFLWAITQCQSVRKYVAEKPPSTKPAKQSLRTRMYRFVYAKMFGSLLAADGRHTRRLSEYWVTECQLLDCFWCCTRHERPRRGFKLRIMRLASSLLVTAAISFFFGTLEFDTTTCTTYANVNLCSSTTSSSALHASPDLVADGFTSSTSSTTFSSTTNGGSTSTSTSTTSNGNGGSTTTTTTTGNGGKTTTTTSGGGSTTSTTSSTVSSTSSSVVNTVETSNSCSAMPPIIDSLSKASSIIAFCVTHCVKFVGSYAQNLGKPGSKLDWGAHSLWLLVAVAAIPVSAVLSTKLLSHGAYTYKSEKLRMWLIVSVTLSAWLQVQVTDIFKVPVIYLAKKFGKIMLPSPGDDVQAVQPRPRDLDCLGGQHKQSPPRDDDDENAEPAKANALAPPRTTKP